MEEREYHASFNGQGLLAPNRVHNLRTYFNGGGIIITGRSGENTSDLLRMSLQEFGREGSSCDISGDALVNYENNRVELVRAGITEW